MSRYTLTTRATRLLARFGVCTFIGLFFAVQEYVGYPPDKPPMGFRKLAVEELGYWYAWALLAPLVVRGARRFSTESNRLSRWLLIHAIAATVYACVHPFLQAVICWAGLGFEDALGTLLQKHAHMVLWDLWLGFVMYGFIVAAIYAYDFQRRARKGDVRAAQLEAQLAQARLGALKMQLHPHFLFNTLHSLSALLHEDVEAADRMIVRLGDFLRLTLRESGTQQVTLAQELEFLQCYLDIEKMRFQERLTVKQKIDPETLQAQVPNLLLQPIVENAIRHGIAPRMTPGHIDIEANRRNGALHIRICDDGPGIPSAETVREGIGLRNTRARLNGLYPTGHSLEFTNAPGGGLQVDLEIPLQIERADVHE